MRTTFSATEDDGFKAWFDDNICYSYITTSFPWTRLGYTYDWEDNGTAHGLTEFVVEKGAAVQVKFTKTVDDFRVWLAAQPS